MLCGGEWEAPRSSKVQSSAAEGDAFVIDMQLYSTGRTLKTLVATLLALAPMRA